MNSRKEQRMRLLLRQTVVLTLLVSAILHTAQARDYFDPAFLESRGQHKNATTDLSVFATDQSQLPGNYYVDIYVNDTPAGTRSVKFQQVKQNSELQALEGCLHIDELKMVGVKTDLFPKLNSEQNCADLSQIPGASQKFDFQEQKLFISIPQIYIASSARGYVPPEMWDEGIPALLMNYSFNGYKDYSSNNNEDDMESKFLALQPGLNVGAWRLRNYTTWNSQSSDTSSSARWSTVYNYLQRDIVPLKSQLTVWDSNTPSDIFDSVAFRGLQLASDEQMLPDSQRGYAPSIHGVARSNAQVTIRQNGRIAYQTTVPPGEFDINDMFPTGSNGDYDVTIKEADGSEQHYVVPYASLPLLQREGRAKYNIIAGKYRDNDNHTRDNFTQATLLYGLPWGITAYGGSQVASDKYQSVALGLGQNMRMLGAISVDGTWSHAKFDDRTETGQSWRIRYSKGVVSTGTTLSIAGYRYASENYNTLEDALNPDDDDYNYYGKRHNRFEASINQRLSSNLGSITLSWVKENYWHSPQEMQSLSVGYNNSWGAVSYALNYSYNHNTYQRYSSDDQDDDDRYQQNDSLFTLSINVPFSLFDSRMYASYMLNARKGDATVNSTTLSGSALRGQNLNWSVQQSHSTTEGDSGGLSGSYKGTYANLNAGYSQSPDSHQISYGIEGGMVAHENGITLSQPITGSAILVKAPGAADVAIENQAGVTTDFRGYTVIPNVTPYYRYDISLDGQTFADNIDIPINNQTVYPTRNALVRATYDTHKGYRVLMTLTRSNGDNIPFGATVSTSEKEGGQANIVGDNGKAFLSGLTEEGNLLVKWGDNANTTCHAAYHLDTSKNMNGIIIAQSTCQ